MGKRKLGVYGGASCGGCDLAVLEIGDTLTALTEAFDIVFWPEIADFKYADVERMADGEIDACLFNGAIRTDENREIAQLLRRKSKALIAFGACASFGGIPGLANLSTREELLACVYETESTEGPVSAIPSAEALFGNGVACDLPGLTIRTQTLGANVQVDYLIPGCPPVGAQVRAVCEALIAEQLPPAPGLLGVGDSSVCDECPLEKRGTKITGFVRPHEFQPDPTRCLLEQGLVCVGPVTRSGCGAGCPTALIGCRGCYGPAGDSHDMGAKMVAMLGGMIDSEDEDEIKAAMNTLVDPLGTFYTFTLSDSILGGGSR